MGHAKKRERELVSNVTHLADARPPAPTPAPPIVPIMPPSTIKRDIFGDQIVTLDEIESWKLPRFQRPFRLNTKMMEFTEGLKANGGFISGVILLGTLPGDPALYKVDGQHRCEAAKMSGLLEFYVTVRIKDYESVADMAEDYERENSSLVRMRPDDLLRAQEENNPLLGKIRAQCSFVGYDNIRRASTTSALLSMSAVLRCWSGSSTETPSMSNVKDAISYMSDEDVSQLCAFLNTAHAAWGRDPEYYRLWGNLNMILLMWLYRQIVLRTPTGNKRHATLNLVQFKQCLTALSASGEYMDYLLGRNIGERDRAPCYRRVREIFNHRMTQNGGHKLRFPQPAWAKGKPK